MNGFVRRVINRTVQHFERKTPDSFQIVNKLNELSMKENELITTKFVTFENLNSLKDMNFLNVDFYNI